MSVNIKEVLCRKAVELEDEIEFCKEAKLPFKKQSDMLSSVMLILENLRDDTKEAWFKARVFVMKMCLNEAKPEKEGEEGEERRRKTELESEFSDGSRSIAEFMGDNERVWGYDSDE